MDRSHTQTHHCIGIAHTRARTHAHIHTHTHTRSHTHTTHTLTHMQVGALQVDSREDAGARGMCDGCRMRGFAQGSSSHVVSSFSRMGMPMSADVCLYPYPHLCPYRYPSSMCTCKLICAYRRTRTHTHTGGGHGAERDGFASGIPIRGPEPHLRRSCGAGVRGRTRAAPLGAFDLAA